MNKAEDSMNVYEQLGFPDAEEMLVKAKLVSTIGEILRERGWSQQQAAKVLGLTQPKLSKMLRGQFRGISEMKMMDCLLRLGRAVKIVVGPEAKPRTTASRWLRRKERYRLTAKPGILDLLAKASASRFNSPGLAAWENRIMR